MKQLRIPIPHLLFVSLLLVLTIISFLFYDRVSALTNASNWVNHSNHVKLVFDKAFIDIIDAETGQRGFLLARDSSFLQLYQESIVDLEKDISAMDSLTIDNRAQQENISEFKKLANARMELLSRNLALFNKNENTLSIIPYLQEGKTMMKKIRNQVDDMMELENTLLAERVKQKNKIATITPFYLLLFSIISLLIVTVAYFRLRSETKLRVQAQYSEQEMERIVRERTTDLNKLNDTLTIKNTIFAHAEENAGVGSYSWNLQTGELEYSDNLYCLLDCEPGEFVPSFEKFIEFIHPEDKQQVIADGKATFETRKLVEHVYRVITKKGILKYFRSSGNFSGESDKQFLIGTVQDVTDDTLLKEDLTSKNLTLEHSNAELASFSYIASHDLQEPLRKIQSFSKLIQNNEASGLSDKSKDYFQRIISAAERMQNLIDALLSYSGAGNAELDLAPADLNLVIEEVKFNLHELITENNVTIETDKLPIVKIISSQFYQLFTNLISNAIKYRRKTIDPTIKISSELIFGESIGELTPDPKAKYWLISVTDNGIGFDPQYEHKIFELFQRLHGRSEYEGTGIGLAICKKIVHNHHGFITATGKPGEGAVFKIYIPAFA